MDKNEEADGFQPNDLPQNEVYVKKEPYQHPQPAAEGLPLKSEKTKTGGPVATDKKEQQKTSKEAGLNEEISSGDAGAFEGFENQGD